MSESHEQHPMSSVPSTRVRAATIGGAILMSVALVCLAFAFTKRPPAPEPAPKGIRIENGRITVEAGSPQWQSLELGEARSAGPRESEKIPARVALDETRAWRVGAPVGGRAMRVLAELGQRVASGQPLLTVASPDVASLRADLSRAQVDLVAARKNLDRVKALVAERALPGKEEIAATQAERQADLAVQLASSRLASLHVSAEGDNEYTVVAPHAGVVVEKNVLPAQEVGPDANAPLLVLGDLSSVWVVADLFEAGAAEIRQGTPARVSFPALPGVSRSTSVEMVSAVYDPARHALPVRLRLDNPDGQLKPNMYAEVQLLGAPPPQATEVTASAIVSDGENQYVYVQARKGEFVRRKVVAASAHGGVVSILSGLTPGEIVVERGAILLDNQVALTD